MKARIKKTGEIANISDYSKVELDYCDSYGNPLEFGFDEVEILQDRTDGIDWEQRRYEIAKDVMCAGLCATIAPGIGPNPSLECLARHAAMAADALIEELKKGNLK